jgi:hypothetical protein
VVFQQEAMPRLRELRIWPLFYVREARGMASSDGGLDFGLGNLLSLQEVKIEILRAGAIKEAAEQAMVPLTHVASVVDPCFSPFPFLLNFIGVVFSGPVFSSNLNFVSISVSDSDEE